ncbi:hypothetical protein PT273_06025 [Orbaceae bacterium ESL0727]|nr:hypothetical protein [Orbaceae bacterium ESL0727]
MVPDRPGILSTTYFTGNIFCLYALLPKRYFTYAPFYLRARFTGNAADWLGGR